MCIYSNYLNVKYKLISNTYDIIISLELDINLFQLSEINKMTDKFVSREDFLNKKFGAEVVVSYQIDNGMKPHFASSAEVINYLSTNTNKKYIAPILKWYVDREFKLEDCDRIKNDIDTYIKHRGKLSVRDLNKLSLGEFYRAIQPFENQLTANEAKTLAKTEGTTKLWDCEHFKVLEITEYEAAAFYGRGTKWCTTNKEQFDYYAKSGPLFIIIAGERKFQMHYESGQFMDEVDQKVTKEDIDMLSEIPEYVDFLNYMINRYYCE